MSGAYLLLEDGTRFDGDSVGAPVPATGEVVFNTSMSGYQESVTDPSYRGQIITFTYPLIGNYGVSEEAMESDRTHARAVIMREGIDRERRSQRRGRRGSPGSATAASPALSGVDTRALVLPHPRQGRDARRRLPRRAGRVRGDGDRDRAEPPMAGSATWRGR